MILLKKISFSQDQISLYMNLTTATGRRESKKEKDIEKAINSTGKEADYSKDYKYHICTLTFLIPSGSI